jgi:hypothetical protein
MNLREILLISLANYAENLRLILPFTVPTGFITGFIYLTGLDLGLSPVPLRDILSAFQGLRVNVEMEIFLIYLSVYGLLMLFGTGIAIGFIKGEIEEEPSLGNATRESYKNFLTLFLLAVFYILLIYLLFSLLPQIYFYGGAFLITFLFLYAPSSIILDNHNFVPALFQSGQRIGRSPVTSFILYLLSLILISVNFIFLLYDLLYFPLILMVVLPFIVNLVTLGYLEEEEEMRCPECGGVLEEGEGILICTKCGAEYVYE